MSEAMLSGSPVICVVWRQRAASGFGERRVVGAIVFEQGRNAEVQQLHITVSPVRRFGDEDVRRLEIAMND
jgi:hypothetical protein